jgi:membrane peptidoglycan carboxypeptidase
MSSHGDDFKVTALQLATLISAMANGGKLITPFVPRTAKEEARSAPKVRRIVNIDAESFKQMVPGMIGAVSYGSGRKAANSREVIAGKTGTCIEQGAWIGLFTSYAPLNNPRLAVVVIGRGVDGRNHFPAAVAGRIYRDLGDRFNSAPTERIAGIIYSSPQITAANNDSLATDDEESDAADDEKATNAASQKVEAPRTIWGDPRRPADSKVKRVVMPLSNRNDMSVNPAKTSTATESKPAERPRRASALPQ